MKVIGVAKAQNFQYNLFSWALEVIVKFPEIISTFGFLYPSQTLSTRYVCLFNKILFCITCCSGMSR